MSRLTRVVYVKGRRVATPIDDDRKKNSGSNKGKVFYKGHKAEVFERRSPEEREQILQERLEQLRRDPPGRKGSIPAYPIDEEDGCSSSAAC